MNVTITSAIPLSAAQKKKLVSAIENKYGTNLEVKEDVQENIMGGIRVTIGSRQLDASIHGKLLSIEAKLAEKL